MGLIRRIGVIGPILIVAFVAVGEELAVLEGGYPRAFNFRQSEALASNPKLDYEAWERLFVVLDGIMGKCLDEEIPGRSLRNIEFFTHYKERHPEKAVLLHFNGNARDPRFEAEDYFAGHWLYYEGCAITGDLAAVEGECVVHVEEPGLFRTEMGRFGDKNEDLAIWALDESGEPDWSRAEQVELLAVDAKAKTLTVRRGAFGTKPLAFAAGKACVAPHVTEGPWGRRSHLLWNYNYSITCPKDAQGRRCSDLLLADLARWFGEGGPLGAFDGLEFDVLHFRPAGPKRRYGKVDVEGYSLGVHDFLTRLREILGPDRLIMADGHGAGHQRSVGVLNGIESEGWPTLSDWVMADWSGGLNRHWFWTQNAHGPRLSYVNHKFIEGGDPRDVPMSTTRLVLAAAQFTDTAVTYSLAPPARKGWRVDVWDELCLGVEERSGWLGKPLGETLRLGFEGKDVLDGAGVDALEALEALAGRWRCEGGAVAYDGALGALRIAGDEPGQEKVVATLPGVAIPGGDLLVRFTAKAEPHAVYGPEMPRLLWVEVRDAGALMSPSLPPTFVGARGEVECTLEAFEKDAAMQYRGRVAIADEVHEAYFVHPPYGRGEVAGYTVWERETAVPKDGAALSLCTGLTQAPSKSDGIVFAVDVVSEGAPERVFEYHHRAFAWEPHEVDLSPWAGKAVMLRFVADCGPDDNVVADHGYWGDVRLAGAGPAYEPAENTAGRIMTWAHGEPFASSFYFREAGPATVDIVVEAEGGTPVYLSELRLHNGPDVMAREFEHGVVLANPSNEAYAFDLGKLFPGKRFRRIVGRPTQDPETNNGKSVAGSVILGARDGLFLVKDGE